jgi:hypothetical protein
MSKIKNAEKSQKTDLVDFNKEFVFKKEQAGIQNKIKSQEKIDRLTAAANKEVKSLYSLSVAELVIGVKDTWFGILDDLLAQKIEMKTLTKENRLFFMGLTIIFIATILYLYNFFLDEEVNNNNNNDNVKIVEKHYIYNNK